MEYADTLLGTQAMFAVRVCAGNEVAARVPVREQVDAPGVVRDPPAAPSFIRESLANVPGDIVVKVFDVDGREVSRHEGALDVCGYARIAAAFVVSDGSPAGVEPR